jgi:hypothetical protein
MNWTRPLEGFVEVIVALWLFEINLQTGEKQ